MKYKKSILTGCVICILMLGFIYLPITNIGLGEERALVFGINERINDDSGSSYQNAPKLALGNGPIYAVWDDFRNGADPDIYFSKSIDGGLNFYSNTRVDDDPSTAHQSGPAIAVDGSNIYIVWQDDRTGNYNIHISKSTDSGANFGTSVRVDDAPKGNQQDPDIAIDSSGDIYVVWQDNRRTYTRDDRAAVYDIYFAKSTDGGSNFGTNVRVDDTGSNEFHQKFPKIALSTSNDIYVTWQDERNGNKDIYFAKSTNGGTSFGTNIRVDHTVGGTSDQTNPSMAVSTSGNIYIVWEDERNGATNADIFLAKSTDGGSGFGTTDTRVDDTGMSQYKQTRPSIDVDTDGGLHIAWSDYRNSNADIYYTSSSDGGSSFGDYMRVDDTGIGTSNQQEPSIAVSSSSNICIGWKDDRNSNFDVYFSHLVEEGTEGHAPSLIDGAIDKSLGGPTEEFKYTVKYVDPENDAPATDYPKLYIYTDSTGTTQFPGSPFIMEVQTYPTQDGDYTNGEIYELKTVLGEEHSYSYKFETKAGTGNLSIVRSGLKLGPIVDMTPVNFSAPMPGSDTWNNKLIVTCNITITDFGGSGVDTSSIQYSMSTSGVDNYGVWKGVLASDNNGYVNCSVDVIFSDGADNYIKWRAKDNLGNGPVESRDYNIKIDSTEVTFSNPTPPPNFWNGELKVTCSITISDPGGSGVDAGSIEYLLTVGGMTTQGWQKAGLTEDNENIECSVEADFQDGTNNYIKWRAYDVAENGPTPSEEYQIKIELGHEVNHIPEPPTELNPHETASKKPNIYWNDGSDIDDDLLEYWIQIGTSAGGAEVLAWTSTGQSTSYAVQAELGLGSYYIQLKAYDGEYYSPVFEQVMNITLTGNTPPEPPNSILPDKIGVSSSLQITWSGAYDPDDDNISYFIQVGTEPTIGDEFSWEIVGSKEYYDVPPNYDFYSEPGIYYIQVTSFDGSELSMAQVEMLEVVNYKIALEVGTSITIQQGKSNSTEIKLDNLGNSMDNITLNLSGSLTPVATSILEQTKVALGANSSTTVELQIKLPSGIAIMDYDLTITATSEDGKTKSEKTIIIKVVQSTDVDDDDKDDGDDTHTRNPALGFFIDFWWLILVIIIIVIVMGIVAAATKTRKKELESKEKNMIDEYDKLYGRKPY